MSGFGSSPFPLDPGCPPYPRNWPRNWPSAEEVRVRAEPGPSQAALRRLAAEHGWLLHVVADLGSVSCVQLCPIGALRTTPGLMCLHAEGDTVEQAAGRALAGLAAFNA